MTKIETTAQGLRHAAFDLCLEHGSATRTELAQTLAASTGCEFRAAERAVHAVAESIERREIRLFAAAEEDGSVGGR